jgi:hypothetical protein
MSDDDIPKPPDNVVELPTKATELRPPGSIFAELIVDNTGKYCQHHPVHVDDRQRRVYCGTCNAPLDAFDELLRVARKHEGIAHARAQATAEVRAAEARLKLLKRLEQNAKARVKKYGYRIDSYHIDAIIDWGMRHFKKRTPETDVTEEKIRRELGYLSPERRLAAALKAIGDGCQLAAVELASSAIDELRAALEAQAEGPVRGTTSATVRARWGYSRGLRDAQNEQRDHLP